MTNLPNFTRHGYEVTAELNNNRQGGRITYKAVVRATQNPVVIKQFRFATTSDWTSYKEIEREIEVLKGLNHKSIPKYLAQFDPGEGLCLVQEYKQAQNLAITRSFSTEEIKNIAIQLLEVLVYLQERIPPIFHRDIKPENVLVDDHIQVYLIDFGLAKIGGGTMAMSSMMGGTLGFMPPEQVHNQKLTEASDLYGLGATLICLITSTKSNDIGSLVDFSNNKIVFKNKVPKLNPKFIRWLEKMVEPIPAKRYKNAKLALKALKPLDIPIRDLHSDWLTLTSTLQAIKRSFQSVDEDVTESNIEENVVTPPPTPQANYQPRKAPTINLVSSETRVDYTPLNNLLAAGKWKQADKLTYNLMLKATNREKEGWIDYQSYKNFPREDLKIMDDLWVKYSNGKFGFSVQKKIWIEVGGTPGEYGWDVFERFGDRIGWRNSGQWLSYSDLTFNINAPEAHLPVFGVGWV